MASFGAKSVRALGTAERQLQDLFHVIVEHRDCSILQGYRDKGTQDRYFREKKSKVKWPDSKHNSFPSRAVDAVPYPIPKNWGAGEVKELVKFYEFAGIVKYEAARMGLNIRWGGDWDGDGDYTDQTFDDLVHFELV